ncbi:MAG: Do family serine endopeptidase [Acidobacteria bacterium]|nr:Do family serine endopeptidase [Acidobacteriota bacterium]
MKQERMRLFSLAGVIVAAVLFGMVLAGGLNLTPQANADRPATAAPTAAPAAVAAPDFASLAAKVVPSVVSVYAKEIIKPDDQNMQGMPNDPFHFFFGPFMNRGQGQRQQPIVRPSAGSGFFISPDGELLTNNHVVENADQLEIQLKDGAKYAVKVVGRDPATDIALIRVVKPDREFPVLSLGESKTARVGEWVMAVGNPLNMGDTVTVGVVSAKGRVLGISDTSFENFIQTDAAINFGNSGGPLVDVQGNVIGINTAINARGQNMGFAVPIDTAKLILPQLREHGKVVRGYLGVTVTNVSPELQDAFGLKDRNGAFVEEVLAGHAGDKAGLEHGDVIIKINGDPVTNTRGLIDRISATPPGTKVKLEVLRNGKSKELTAVLEERKIDENGEEANTEPAQEQGGLSDRLGITVSNLTPQLRQMYSIDDSVNGVVITKVKPMSAAGDNGLQRGDVVTELNGEKVTSASGLVSTVKKMKSGGYARLYVYRPRADRSFFAIIKLKK